MLTLAVGIFFLFCGFGYRLPIGVTVNGVDVGGLTVRAAKVKLDGEYTRYLKGKELHICADERIFTFNYPEFNYRADFDKALLGAVKGGNYSVDVEYYLNGEDEVLDYVCRAADRQVVEPYAAFNPSGQPFTYFAGSDGRKCDREKLKSDIYKSLNGGFGDVVVSCRRIARTGSVETVKKRTQLLYTFTTFFDGSNEGRSANIRLAASKINGTVLEAGDSFSFNTVVGPRTRENGFGTAKIIEGGRFVDGVGGGVCQVSTTVYNAALLSGLEIEEFHPHSLSVSYVPPSRDAMVSGSYFDLRFKNNRKTPIYIRMKGGYDCVTCSVYGLPDGYSYSFVSEVVGTLPPPEPKIEEGEEDKVISREREGTLSCGYLVRKNKNGEEEKALIRTDKYAAVGEVRIVKNRPEDGE